MGRPPLLPTRRKVCRGFLSLLKSTALAGFEPATLGPSGKHTNHYTTVATEMHIKLKQNFSSQLIVQDIMCYVDIIKM
jgi:hypothetical protein